MSEEALPGEWRQALDQLDHQAASNQQSRLVVCGCKGAGKSTFARLLTNQLLSRAGASLAYLDTDCGQAEFTPAGLMSLHLLSTPVVGQPHQHLRQADRARFIGELSCAGDPVRYVAAVEGLLTDGPTAGCQPLIVNTAGWVKGIGLEVLTGILQAVQPTHVILLQTGNPTKDLPVGNFWEEAPSLPTVILTLPAVPALDGISPGGLSSPRRLPPAESRALSWLAFAKACCGEAWDAPAPQCDSAAFAQAASQLAAQEPFQASCSEVALQVMHMHVDPNQLLQVANCAVVGLIACGNTGPSSPVAQQPCLGLGIVRAVDPARGLLYLLTPLPAEQLQQVNLLQIGRLELPPTLLHSKHTWSPYLAVGSLTAVGTGAGHVHARTDLARPGRIALA